MYTDWVKSNELTSYFIIAFVTTWLLVLPLVLSTQGIINVSISSDWHVLGSIGPIFSALVVTRLVHGKSGLNQIINRLCNWGIGVGWLLVGLLSPILLFILAAIIVRLTSGDWPNFAQLTTTEYANLHWVLGSLLSALAYGIGEEVGWRGFALPRLQRSMSALKATFILTLFWALWHLPMFFYRFDFSLAHAVGFFIGMFAGAILLTFFFNSTGGSIFMVAAWHTTWNVVNILGLAVSMDVVSLMSAVVIITAFFIVIVGRPSQLSVHKKVIV